MPLWPPASREEFLELAKDERTVVLNNLAASAFLFWDYLLTFSREIDFIWRGKWSYITALYLFGRYFALAVMVMQLLIYADVNGLLHLTPESCLVWLKLEIIAYHTLAFAVDLVLASRVYALYGSDRRMLYLLTTILFGGQVAAIVYLGLVINVFRAGPLPLPRNLAFGACITMKADPRFHHYFLTTVIVETLLTLIFIFRSVPILRARTGIPLGTHFSDLMLVFIRDGLWAYAFVCAVLLWVYIAYQINLPKGDIAIAWLFAVHSFAITRLILNLRIEANKWKHTIEDTVIELRTYRTFSRMDIRPGYPLRIEDSLRFTRSRTLLEYPSI